MVNLSVYEQVQKCKSYDEPKSTVAGKLGISRATVRKYWKMSRAEFDRYQETRARRTRRFEAHRQEIVDLLERNAADRQQVYVSSIYDVLEERHGSLPGGVRSLGNYVAMLYDSGAVSQEPSGGRVRRPMEEQPAGRQCQVDFGEYTIRGREKAYIYAAILARSRARYVAVQDHPFHTLEVVRHTLDAFEYFGGRVEQVAIDQDRLMTVSENGGEIVHTALFEQFLREQELDVWLCGRHDPESKGKVENLVKFVKTSFFSARTFNSVDEIHEPLRSWLARRANGKVCAATGRIPAVVLEQEERPAMRALRSSIFAADALDRGERRQADHKAMISFAANRYSVPAEYENKAVIVLAADTQIYVHDPHTREQIACHRIPAGKKGQNIVLPQHRVPHGQKADEVFADLAKRFESPSWQAFLAGNRRAYARYWKEQAATLRRIAKNIEEPAVFEQALVFCVESGSLGAGDLKHAIRHLTEAGANTLPPLLEHAKPILAGRRASGDHTVSKRHLGYYSSLLSLVAGVLA